MGATIDELAAIYRREVGRLYGVLDRQLGVRRFAATDDFTVADMAIWPWARSWENQEQTLDDKPNLARWLRGDYVIPGAAVEEDERSDREGEGSDG